MEKHEKVPLNTSKWTEINKNCINDDIMPQLQSSATHYLANENRVVKLVTELYPETTRDLPLCTESEAKIFVATIQLWCLIVRIDMNNVHAWTVALASIVLDMYADRSCTEVHLFLVCRATAVDAIKAAPGNRRWLAACTGISCGRSLSIQPVVVPQLLSIHTGLWQPQSICSSFSGKWHASMKPPLCITKPLPVA